MPEYAARWPHVLNKARAPDRKTKILAPDPRDIIDKGGPATENTVLKIEIESLKEELKKMPKIPARRGRPKAEA